VFRKRCSVRGSCLRDYAFWCSEARGRLEKRHGDGSKRRARDSGTVVKEGQARGLGSAARNAATTEGLQQRGDAEKGNARQGTASNR